MENIISIGHFVADYCYMSSYIALGDFIVAKLSVSEIRGLSPDYRNVDLSFSWLIN